MVKKLWLGFLSPKPLVLTPPAHPPLQHTFSEGICKKKPYKRERKGKRALEESQVNQNPEVAPPDPGHVSGWRQKSWPTARWDRLPEKSVQVQIPPLFRRFAGHMMLEAGGTLP